MISTAKLLPLSRPRILLDRAGLIAPMMLALIACVILCGGVAASDSPNSGSASVGEETAKTAAMIDGIAILVNNVPVTRSEIARDLRWLRIESPDLLAGKSTTESVLTVIDRTIDRQLVLQDIKQTQFVTVPKHEVDERFEAIRQKLLPDRVLANVLAEIHFDQDEFYLYLWAELMVENYRQQKLKPRVKIDPGEISGYLSEHHLDFGITAEEAAGGDSERLTAAREAIKARLTDQQMERLFTEKMTELRQKAVIQVFIGGPDPNREEPDTINYRTND